MFSVKDKFSSTTFRTSSKEDMFGWYSSFHAGSMRLLRPSKSVIHRSTWTIWKTSSQNPCEQIWATICQNVPTWRTIPASFPSTILAARPFVHISALIQSLPPTSVFFPLSRRTCSCADAGGRKDRPTRSKCLLKSGVAWRRCSANFLPRW